MIKVETNDGITFTGSGAQDIVRQMKNTQWTVPDTKSEYIAQVIERVSGTNGEAMPDDYENFTPEALLMFLDAHGLITISPYHLAEDLEEDDGN